MFGRYLFAGGVFGRSPSSFTLVTSGGVRRLLLLGIGT
jgi:hypothetical protein